MTWQLALIAAAWVTAAALAWAWRGDREDAEAAHTYGAGIAQEVQP